MLCPKCSLKENRVTDVRHTKENETLRQRVCRNCGCTFYTTEFVVDPNESFVALWQENERRKAWKNKCKTS